MANTGDNNKKKPKKKATKKAAPKKRKKAPTKKGYQGNTIWNPISGATFGGGYSYADPLPEMPSPTDLLCAFEDIAFACITRISTYVGKSASSYKLCVTTGRDDQAPKSLTKSLSFRERERITGKHKKYTRKAVTVEEITDHPVLDLLDKPNPFQSFAKLMELTVEYMGSVGSAFWYKSRNELGQVAELWLLPSHLIQIDVDDETGALRGYKFQSGNTEQFYPPQDVIHFKWTEDLLDPYTSFGVSPLRAIWQRFSLLRQEQGSWQAVLRNMAYPSLIANPPENETWTPQQAERIEKQLNEKFRWSNQAGVFAVQDSAKITPFGAPPKDLAALQMYDSVRKAIIQEYGIPLPIMDMSDTTFASAEVAKRLFQEGCIVPILDAMYEVISHDLLPARMFLAGDDLLQPDKVFDLQRTTALVGANVITVNEARVEQGYEPKDGLDKLLVELSPTIGTASAQTFQGASFTGGRAKTKGYKSTAPDATKLAEVLKSLYQRLGQDVLGRLKNADGISTKSFFPVKDWADEMVRELVPVLRVYMEEGGTAVLSEIGGSVKVLPVNQLDEAVKRAALAFAESTLSTTTTSVEDAVKATRDAIEQGLSQGEANAELSKRVGAIFEDLSERRAMLIAETESSRMKHSGELMAIDEAGVTAKKVWLPDNMACDLCKELARKGGVPLDQPFATKGTGPYSVIDHPPGHPGCRCSLQYEFTD